MSIETTLEHKKINNPVKDFKKELKNILENETSITKVKLKKEVAVFGLELLELKHNYYDNYVSLDSKE
jgi:hypothetical protein